MRYVAGRFGELFATALVLGMFGAASASAQQGTNPAASSPPQQQSGGGTGFGVQVMGGPTFSTLADAKTLDPSASAGYLVGLGLGGNRGGVVGVEADILYGRKGVKVSSAGVDEDFDQNVIHVPVMLKINIGSGGANGFRVFGLGGGFFDWQFSSKLGDVDVTDDTEGYGAGYVLGGGVEIVRLSIQGRYMRGLTQISKDFDLASSEEAKSQSFAILVGIRLN